MKKIILFVLLFGLLPNLCRAKIVSVDYSNHIIQFQNMVENDEVSALAHHVKYPLHRAYPLKPINNDTEFIAHYHEIFDENQKQLILSVSPDSDIEDDVYGKIGWYKSSENTLMLKRPLIASFIDLDLDGNLENIILSKTEHSMIKNYQKDTDIIQIIQTDKFIIRIKKVDGRYQYASWSNWKLMTDSPDLILSNGVYKDTGGMIEPSGEYVFKNGQYTYIIENKYELGVNGDILYTQLKVFGPGNNEILSQPGILIYD